MKKVIVAFVSAVLLSATFGVASAQMGCGKMGQGMMGGMMAMPALGLDSRQTEAVNGIRSRTMKEMVRKRAEMQIAAIELSELLGRDSVDMKAVESALRKMEAMRTEMRLSHIKAKMEIMSVLTPEQKKRFNELMMRRPMMRGMGRGMMGGMSGMGGMMMDGTDDGVDDGDDMDDDMMMEPAPQSSSDEMKGKKEERREHSH